MAASEVYTNERIEKQRSNEYVALRAELLSLHERAHAVWRWGLTAIVALLGAVVTVVVTILTRNQSLTLLLTNCITLSIALALYLFAAGIVITLANLSASIRNSMNRLGAYLAFFHDQPVSSPFAYSLGWHIWNRIEKICPSSIPPPWCKALGSTLRKMSSKGRPEEKHITSSTEHHGEPKVYIVVLLFFVIFVSGLVNAVANASLLEPLLSLGFITVAVVWLHLKVVEQQYIDAQLLWTRRWFQLCQDEINIKEVLLQKVFSSCPSSEVRLDRIWDLLTMCTAEHTNKSTTSNGGT
jgi:hypothetical protein